MASRKRSDRSITDRRHWPDYVGGILTETGFIVGLTLIALALAAIAQVIWR
ncbi:MAG: hypothetical protein ACYCX5_06020 [Coriobacteriia bacterium]